MPPSSEQIPDLISTRDAALITGYTPGYISKLIKQGKFSAERAGHVWLVSRSELEKYFASVEAEREQRREELSRERSLEYRAATATDRAPAAASTPQHRWYVVAAVVAVILIGVSASAAMLAAHQELSSAVAVAPGTASAAVGASAPPATGFAERIALDSYDFIARAFGAGLRAFALLFAPNPQLALDSAASSTLPAPPSVAAPTIVTNVSTTRYLTPTFAIMGVDKNYVDARVDSLQNLMFANMGNLADHISHSTHSSSGGSGSVTSVDASGGTTGLTFTGGPITSTGTLTLDGVLATAAGGTGVAAAPAYGQLLLGNAVGGYDLVSTSTLGIAASGNPSWGDIIGTLSNQTDLQNALDAKFDASSFGASFYSFFHATTTDALTQGAANKYYATNLFAADLAGTTTDALREGTNNLYWTNTRFDNRLSATTSLANLTTLASLSLPLTQTTGTLGVSRGGTGTTTGGVTNGVEYYDGTKLTNSSALTWDGSLFTSEGTINTPSSYEFNGSTVITVALGGTGGLAIGDIFSDFPRTNLYGQGVKIETLMSNGVGISSTTPGSLLSIGSTNGINFSTATSTFSSTGGINLTAGCFAVGGTCIGTGGTGVTSLQQLGGGSAQTGAITFATSSDASTGLTSSLSITNVGGAFTFAPTLAGTLNVANGGTGTTTGGVTNGVEYYDGSKITNGSFFINTGSAVGIGTTTPFAPLSIMAGGDYGAHALSTVFAIGSSTAGTATSTLLKLTSDGKLTFGGVLQTIDTTASPFGIRVIGNLKISAGTASTDFTQQASAAGTPYSFNFPADSGMTAGVNGIGFNIIGAARKHVNGAVALQSDVNITPSSYTFTSFNAGANIITDLASLTIGGTPIGSTNARVTNAHAFLIQSSALDASTTNAYGLTVNAPTGAVNNYAAEFLGGNVGIGTSSPFAALSVGGNTYLGGNLTATGTETLSALATPAGSFLAVNASGAVIATSSPSLTSLSGILGIANGGTGTSTGGVTNGVEYYDGTKLTNSAALTWDGGTLIAKAGSGTGNFTIDNASSGNDTYISVDRAGVEYGRVISGASSNGLSINAVKATGTLYFGAGSVSAQDLAITSAHFVGVGTTSPFAKLSVAGSIFANDSITGSNITATGTLNVTGQTTLASSLTGLLKATAGVVSTAVAGTDYIAGGAGAATTTVTCAGSTSCTGFVAFGSSPITITGSGLASYDAWTHASIGSSATTSAIGIGTTTPWAQLSVSSTTAGSATTALFAVASNTNATLFSVMGNGYVGIGTIPDSPLSVSNPGSSNSNFQFADVQSSSFTQGFSSSAHNLLTIVNNNSGTSHGGITVNGYGNGGYGGAYALQLSGHTALTSPGSSFPAVFITGTKKNAGNGADGEPLAGSDIILSVGSYGGGGGSPGNQQFNFLANGNFGIGTTSPYGSLAVNGVTSATVPLLVLSQGSGQTSDYLSLYDSTGNKAVSINQFGNLVGAFSTLQFAAAQLQVQSGGTPAITLAGVYGGGQTANIVSIYQDDINVTDVINNRAQFAIGTSSTPWQLDVATSSTGALFNHGQIGITDTSAGANLKHWLLSSEGGSFYISSSSDTFATSTIPALAIDANGNLSLARALTGASGGTGSTTLSGLLAGNGTSGVKTAVIGTGLTFDGTTLSASGGSGGGTISTSSAETAGQLSYWTTTNGYPAKLGSIATTSATLGLGLSYSGTLGALVGGSSGSLTIATSSLYSGTTGQFPYFSGTNTITATSSLFLAANGNIGVGTTTPSYHLDLQAPGTTNVNLLRLTANDGHNTPFAATLDGNGDALLQMSSIGAPVGIRLSTGSGTSYFSGSKLGVGTTSAWGLLSVNPDGLAAGVPAFVIGSSTATEFAVTTSIGGTARVSINALPPTGPSAPSPLNVMGAAGGGGTFNMSHEGTVGTFQNGGQTTIDLYDQNSTIETVFGDTQGGIGFAGTLSNTDFALYSSSAARLTVAAGGNIGIGTTSPFATLSVAGNIFANSSITGSNITATGTVSIPALATPAGSFLAVNASGTIIATTTPVGGGGGVTSLQQLGGGVAQTGAITLATSSDSSTGLITQLSITNSGGAFTFAPSLSGTLNAANGGTGSTTLGGILVGNGTSALNSLTLPSFLSLSGNTLSLNGALGLANGGTGTTTFYAGGLVFGDGSKLTQSAAAGNFFWDETNKRLGLGTTTPKGPLAIQTATDAAGAFTIANSIGSTTVQVDTSDNSTSIFTVATSTGASYFDVGATNGALTFSTAAYASCTGLTTNSSGVVQCSVSDQRLKQNVISLDGATGLAAISALNPVSYTYIDPERPQGVQYGLIAQQVQQVLPALVATSSPTSLTPDGTLTVNYNGLFAPLIKSVQELDARTKALASSTPDSPSSGLEESLTNSVDALSSRVSVLEDAGFVLGTTSTSTPDTASWSDALQTALTSALDSMSLALSSIQHMGSSLAASLGVFDTVFAGDVHTDKLCVGDTCVTQEQFLEMVQKSGVGSSTPVVEVPPVDDVTDSTSNSTTTATGGTDMSVPDTSTSTSTDSGGGAATTTDSGDGAATTTDNGSGLAGGEVVGAAPSEDTNTGDAGTGADDAGVINADTTGDTSAGDSSQTSDSTDSGSGGDTGGTDAPAP